MQVHQKTSLCLLRGKPAEDAEPRLPFFASILTVDAYALGGARAGWCVVAASIAAGDRTREIGKFGHQRSWCSQRAVQSKAIYIAIGWLGTGLFLSKWMEGSVTDPD